MAQVEIVYQDAFDRVAEGSPVDQKGEMKESVKRLLETAEVLHSWVADLLKAFPQPEPTGPTEHHITFTYEDPLDLPATAPANGEARVEPPAASPGDDAGRRQGVEERAVVPPPVPPPPQPPRVRLPERRPVEFQGEDEDMSGRLGWRTVAGADDDDED
jgi:hypothetical protein